MKAIGIVRRFDDLGRIVIPKEIRQLAFGTKNVDGIPIEIFIDRENEEYVIVLKKYNREE